MNFLPTLRSLVKTYQAFEEFAFPQIRQMGLTPTQFDIIATLANQPPMTFKELGEKSFISKSSLCGVIQRMVQKQILQTCQNDDDGRSMKIALTPKGEAIFNRCFPAHIAHLASAFNQLNADECHDLSQSLNKLAKIFNQSP